MKVTITGFENNPETFIYTVRVPVSGAITGSTSMGHGVEKRISGEALNALSEQFPHSRPGQMSEEEILLATIHDTHYVDDGADLIGKSAASYKALSAVLEEVRKVRIPPSKLVSGPFKLNEFQWTVYERVGGMFAVRRNDAANPVYLADNLDDAFAHIRVEMTNRLSLFMPR